MDATGYQKRPIGDITWGNCAHNATTKRLSGGVFIRCRNPQVKERLARELEGQQPWRGRRQWDRQCLIICSRTSRRRSRTSTSAEKFEILAAIGARAIISWISASRYQIDLDVMDETTSVGDAGQSIATDNSTALFRLIVELLVAITTRLQRLDGIEDETRDHAILCSLRCRTATVQSDGDHTGHLAFFIVRSECMGDDTCT